MAVLVQREPTYVTNVANESAFTVYHVVNFAVGIVELLLAFRFILRLVGASSAGAFARFIYGMSEPLVRPFYGIFNSTGVDGSVVEWSVLVAMAVYAIISYLVLQLVSLIANRNV